MAEINKEDDLRKRIEKEIHEENRRIYETQEREKKHEAYGILLLIISLVLLFGTIFAGEHVTIVGGIFALAGIVLALHWLHIF